mmetsp:Transcript_13902/g.19754  ORF Transcript_13902/g.19754 Transcript_13902/m.19754 type:complete len:191 (-) Transcript_13902:205-777(-)
MPPHVQIDHHDDLQEASSPLSHRCLLLNDTNAGSEQSPLFQDDLSSQTAASPLDALRKNEDGTICNDSVSVGRNTKKPKAPIKRITGIEAIIGSESRYAQNEVAAQKSSSASSSSSTATVATSSTSTTVPTSDKKGVNKKKKTPKTNKVNSVLFPKDSAQRRKQIAGFFRKGKKIASSIMKKKKKSKTSP